MFFTEVERILVNERFSWNILYSKVRDITLSSYSRSGSYLHAESNFRENNATEIVIILRDMVLICLHIVRLYNCGRATREDTTYMICTYDCM